MIEVKLTVKNIALNKAFKTDIKDGLLVVFDKETKYLTKYSTADIKAFQTKYSKPDETRKIEAVYIRAL